jgi:hypothetical protein
VSQISPPIRIVLVAAIGLIAAWMLFLKPSSGSSTTPAASSASAPTAPGVKGLTRAIAKAHGAAATQAKSDAAVQKATGGAATATGAAAASTPAVEAARKAVQGAAAGKATTAHDLPLPVLKAIAAHQVMVLLFWNPDSADDQAVKKALGKVNRWKGEVFVSSAPIKTISDYGRITRGADVEQSPTVVVVDRKLRATNLVGYVDTQSIDQAVVDARRNSGVLVASAYLRKVNQLCATSGVALNSTDLPGNASDVSGFLSAQTGVLRRFETRFEATNAPAPFRAFKRGAAADMKSYTAAIADWAAYLGPHPTQARALSSLPRFIPRAAKSVKRYDARMDSHNVRSCGSNS